MLKDNRIQWIMIDRIKGIMQTKAWIEKYPFEEKNITSQSAFNLVMQDLRFIDELELVPETEIWIISNCRLGISLKELSRPNKLEIVCNLMNDSDLKDYLKPYCSTEFID